MLHIVVAGVVTPHSEDISVSGLAINDPSRNTSFTKVSLTLSYGTTQYDLSS